MRIAIVNLTGGGLSGGYQKYLKMILPLLEQHPVLETMNVYIPSRAFNPFHSSPKTQLVSIVDSYGINRKLRKEIKDSKPDVVFIPTARWFNTGSVPCAIMVRNMEPLIDPFGKNKPIDIIKNLLRAYVAKHACGKADKIIAVSNFVRNFLIDKWAIPEDKIEVVYHGGEKPAPFISIIPPLEIPDTFRKDFIFTAGSIRPARGLDDLFEALVILKKSGIEKKLVIAGEVSPSTWNYKNQLDRKSARLGIKDQIFWTGSIDSVKMAWYYYNCSVFVMTSRMEACPNVALEAMSYQCLCISTESPPMPEFFREAAMYYLPQDSRALAGQLIKVDSLSLEEKIRMKENAKKRAADFTWEKCAESTMELLLKIRK